MVESDEVQAAMNQQKHKLVKQRPLSGVISCGEHPVPMGVLSGLPRRRLDADNEIAEEVRLEGSVLCFRVREGEDVGRSVNAPPGAVQLMNLIVVR